jgi:hypothetical protein
MESRNLEKVVISSKERNEVSSLPSWSIFLPPSLSVLVFLHVYCLVIAYKTNVPFVEHDHLCFTVLHLLLSQRSADYLCESICGISILFNDLVAYFFANTTLSRLSHLHIKTSSLIVVVFWLCCSSLLHWLLGVFLFLLGFLLSHFCSFSYTVLEQILLDLDLSISLFEC